MKSFRELEVYKACKQLAGTIYAFSDTWPKEETFNMKSQIRRAAISIVSNLAEGCGRSSNKDTIHFLFIARGSTYEVEAQADMACDFRYITEQQFQQLLKEMEQTRRLLSGFINYYQSLPQATASSQPTVDDSPLATGNSKLAT